MSEVRKCLSGETNDTQTQDQKQGPIFLWKNTEKVGVYDLVDDYYDPEAPCRFARKLDKTGKYVQHMLPQAKVNLVLFVMHILSSFFWRGRGINHKHHHTLQLI